MVQCEPLPGMAEIVEHFGLKPHPEGGFYAEIWRSQGLIAAAALPPEFAGSRPYCTLILYLLGRGDKSALHRLRQEEVWHFHLGGPLELVHISPHGQPAAVRLGQNFRTGDLPHCVVPAGHWFGARPAPESPYCLVGCTVAPGFEFADFTMAAGPELAARFPRLAGLIREFT